MSRREQGSFNVYWSFTALLYGVTFRKKRFRHLENVLLINIYIFIATYCCERKPHFKIRFLSEKSVVRRAKTFIYTIHQNVCCQVIEYVLHI